MAYEESNPCHDLKKSVEVNYISESSIERAKFNFEWTMAVI
jgi:hypothetical protein